jgi:hypothetical protein
MYKQKDTIIILEDLKKLSDLWIGFHNFLMMSFTSESITQEKEHEFLEIKSQTSKYLRVLAQRIDSRQFKYEPDKTTTLLRQAISVVHLRGLPMADRKNLVVLWHEVSIHASQVLGAFGFISEGYQPKKKERKDTTIAGLKKAAGGEKKKKSAGGKTALTIMLVLIVVVALVIIIKR